MTAPLPGLLPSSRLRVAGKADWGYKYEQEETGRLAQTPAEKQEAGRKKKS
jgi:hypothetical protein